MIASPWRVSAHRFAKQASFIGRGSRRKKRSHRRLVYYLVMSTPPSGMPCCCLHIGTYRHRPLPPAAHTWCSTAAGKARCRIRSQMIGELCLARSGALPIGNCKLRADRACIVTGSRPGGRAISSSLRLSRPSVHICGGTDRVSVAGMSVLRRLS